MVCGAGGRYPKALWGGFCVVVFSPAFRSELCACERAREFPVRQVVLERGVGALDMTLLPWAARRDESSFRGSRLDPGPDVFRDDRGTRWRPARMRVGHAI